MVKKGYYGSEGLGLSNLAHFYTILNALMLFPCALIWHWTLMRSQAIYLPLAFFTLITKQHNSLNRNTIRNSIQNNVSILIYKEKKCFVKKKKKKMDEVRAVNKIEVNLPQEK